MKTRNRTLSRNVLIAVVLAMALAVGHASAQVYQNQQDPSQDMQQDTQQDVQDMPQDTEMPQDTLQDTQQDPMQQQQPDQQAVTWVEATDQLMFEPDNITVSVGSTVRWVNNGTLTHTVTSAENAGEPTPDGRFDSTLLAGGTYEFTFDEAGTYDYYCQIHPEMWGTVVVEEGDVGTQPTPDDTPDNTLGESPTPTDGVDTPGPAAALVLGLLGLLAVAARRR